MLKDERNHDYLEHSKIHVARCIEQECKEIKCKRTHYNLNIDIESTYDMVSPTLSSLLSMVTPKLNRTLAAAMVGNVVTSHRGSR